MLAPNPLVNFQMPDQPAPKWHDVTIKRKIEKECARVAPVPPEEFGISSRARNIQDSGYCYHAVRKSVSELISEGYDPDEVKNMPTSILYLNAETTSRDTVDESSFNQVSADDDNSNRPVLIIEHYILMDYEGNGKPAVYKIVTGEEYEPIAPKGEDICQRMEFFPFAAMTPVIMTHRFWGRSVADLVIDIQKIKTVLVRGLLDNLYRRNHTRTEIAESHASDNTIEDLLNDRPNGVVRTKQPGGLNPLIVEDISPAIYPALQYFDATREWRTGVSRQGQGIDPNALQNQVATIANQMEQMSDKKVKLIARIFADTGIRDLFSLLHATIRKHGSKAQTVRLRNQWVNVDPRDWKQRDDLTIKVGLGSGNKAQQMAGIQQIINSQIQGVQAGLVSKRNFWNTAQAMCKVLGYPDASQFFTDPDAPMNPQDQNATPIQPPPDPKQQEAAQKAQIEQAKIQADAAHQKMKIEQEQAIETIKMQHQAALEEIRSQNDKEIALLRAQIEREKMAHDAALAAHKANLQAQPKAVIDVKHGANEITGPLGEAIAQFGQHMAQTHQSMMEQHKAHMERQHQHLTALVAHIAAPKKIVYGPNGRPSHTETIGTQH